MSERNHRVRLHNWRDGILAVTDHWFEEMEHALEFAIKSGAHSAKVYNPTGDIVHTLTPVKVNTYA